MHITIPDPTTHEGFKLWKKSNEWRKQVNEILKPFQLNQTDLFHLVILIWLQYSKTEVTQISLSNYVGTEVMSTSKIVRKLEKLKLIQRQTGKDPRSFALTVTQAGKELAVITAPILRDVEASFFGMSTKKH